MARLKELEEENRRLKKMDAEERLKAEIVQETLEKSGDALSPPRDGAVDRPSRRRPHPVGRRGVRDQPDGLQVSGEAIEREPRDRRLADAIDRESAQLGVRAGLLVSAQRPGLPLESQAGVPHHVPGVGIESQDQA